MWLPHEDVTPQHLVTNHGQLTYTQGEAMPPKSLPTPRQTINGPNPLQVSHG